jgi:hypothetical protein
VSEFRLQGFELMSMAGAMAAGSVAMAVGSVCELHGKGGPGPDVNFRSSFVPAFRHNFFVAGRVSSCENLNAGSGVRAQAASVAEAAKVSPMVKWQESKRIQTQSVVIGPETKTIRSLDWDRDRFDMYVTLALAPMTCQSLPPPWPIR